MSFTPGIQAPVLDEDGKQVVVTYPATDGFRTFFTGRGDGAPGPDEKGTGTQMVLSFTGADTKSVEIGFNAVIEVHDGEVHWSPPPMADFIAANTPAWGPADAFSVGLRLPATVAVANGSGTGNANKVALGGGANLIVPAAGDGAWDVDLDEAVPIDAKKFVGGELVTQGFWDCDYFTGTVTPSATPGEAAFHLLDFENFGWLVRNVPMSNPSGVFSVDVYKTEWVHPSWRFLFEVVKVSAGAGDASGWIMTFREPG